MSRTTPTNNFSMPYGDASIISFTVGTNVDANGLVKYRFVGPDAADVTNQKPIKYPAAGAARSVVYGVVGGYRQTAPATGTSGTTMALGTTASPFISGQTVPVTVWGSDLVEAAVTDSKDDNYIVCGDVVKTDATGKAVKWVAPTITPDMTATFAVDTDPTGTEVAAYVAEYCSEYAAALLAAAESKLAMALSSPDEDNLIRFEFL